MKWVILDKDFITEQIRAGQQERVLSNGQALLRVNSKNESFLIDFKKYTADEIALLNLDQQSKLKSKHSNDIDDSGRQITRITYNSDGWSFLAHFVELTTSTIGGIYCQDENGNEEIQHYAQFFDVDGNQLLTQAECDASCVKSVFTIIPAIDYEIVSGEIHQYERPTTNMRMHTRLGAFLPDGTPLSTKEFVRNLNMKFKDKAKAIVTDGRAPKMLRREFAGLPFDANQIQIIIYHPDAVGFKHECMIEIEYYRE
jgi:hypothetical protein